MSKLLNRPFSSFFSAKLALFFIFSLVSCGGGGGSEPVIPDEPTPPPVVDSGSVNFAFTITSHPLNNLMATASLTTEAGSTVVIDYKSDDTSVRQTAASEMGTEHQFNIIGLRANTQYSFTAVVTDNNQQTTSSELVSFDTGDLPPEAPAVELVTKTDTSFGGITFFASTQSPSRFFGVDEDGEYVWYLHGDDIPMSPSPTIKSLGDGRLMLLLTRQIWIINLYGDVLQTYELPAYHHDAVLLPNDNLLILVAESRTVAGEILKGDRILELDAAGNTIWQWSSFDYLDTDRFPGEISNRINNGEKDWTHSNAIHFLSHDDSILLSSRSQSWVININHSPGNSTGEILWIMGDDEGASAALQDKFFTLNSGSWMANQHAPLLTSVGEILMYDNRNEAALAGSLNNSRAVRYNLNTNLMTAEQTWEFISPKYTSSLGDVDELSNGNILVSSGGPGSSTSAEIIEVSPDPQAEVRWQVRVLNTSIYRVERISWEEFLSVDTQQTDNSGTDNGSNLIDTENCAEAIDFVDTNNPDNYIDFDMDGRTNADLYGDDLTPILSVSCDEQTLFVNSNGATNFDWVSIANGASSPSVIEHNWTIPRNPYLTDEKVAIPLLGPIAITVTGIQIYGPNENAADNYANPVTDGLMNYCGGHTREYHLHERAHCFFQWPTLGGADSLLPTETAGVILGYALDGFPIMSPWECSDVNCTSTVKVESSYRYIGNGDYANENAWNYHEYEQQLSPLDECNGMSRPDGSYAYYATDSWPYYMACYRGPTNLVGDNNPRFTP